MSGAPGPDVAANVAEVRRRIASAARRGGRDASDVTLVAVSKTVDAARVADALAAGVPDLGESRAQELLAKAPRLPGARWHFVGRLQRNKVRVLAPHVALWHSVDRAALGEEVARHAPGAPVLVQVNVGREPQKGGCDPDRAGDLAERLAAVGLRVEGLMAVPPLGEDPRPHFDAVAALGAALGLRHLSMGMSDDFEAAAERGATIVRVGRAVFGDRPAP